MSNLRLVSNNLATDATLSASSEAGALVVENLQLDSKTKVLRSVGTTQSITATFTSAPVSCVALPICNLTSTATMRVRVYTLSGDTSPALDTGNLLCCEYTTIDKIDFADGPLNANTFNYGGGTYASLFFTETVGEKVVTDIVDTSNTSGYIDASFIVVGADWQPVYNADYGVALAINDTSKHSRNDSGDLMTDRGARYKSIRFSLGMMQTLDRTNLMEIFIKNGMSTPVFISFFPESSDDQEKQIYQIYGKQKKSGIISRYRFNLDKSQIDVEEI